jgi:hypothetical protein
MSKKKKRVSLDAHTDALNWTLVLGAVVTAFAPPVGLLAAGVAVSTGMWIGAGLSTGLALLAGNVKRAGKGDAPAE